VTGSKAPSRRSDDAAEPGAPGAHGGLRGIPVSPGTFVPRQRLDVELDNALSKPLTVLVAPAGSGKTAAVARWARRQRGPVHWLVAQRGAATVELGDALLAAGGIDVPRPRRKSGGPGDVARRLGDGAADPRVVVVDDAQYLDPDSWALLETVLDSVPDRVHVVLLSRRDPPMSTVALELSDGLTLLRADSLRFDDDEARRLVTAHAPDADPDDVAAVQARARGWAAALVLGARSLAGAPDRVAARVALARTEQPVLDYLLGEVFTTVPAATRHLLLCTADEVAVTEAAAVALSGDDKAAGRLADLAAAGLLVTTYETPSGTSWTYHPLLRELLRRQVATDGPDQQLARAAHHRAARQYALLGSAAEAVRHATAAGEIPLLAELLWEHGLELLTAGPDGVVDAGLLALPPWAFDGWPGLLGVSALALRERGEIAEALRAAAQHARMAEEVRSTLGARTPSTAEAAHMADAALLAVWMARYGWADLADSVATARTVLGEGAGPASARPLDPARLSWLLHELAAAELWLGDLDAATRHAAQAVLTARAVGNHELTARGLGDLALVQLLQGNVRSAEATVAECLREAAYQGISSGVVDCSQVVLACAAVYDLRLAEAEGALAAMVTPDTTVEPLVAALAVVVAAWLLAERGDVVGARQLLTVEPPLPEPVPTFVDATFAVSRVHWALVAGDRPAAEHEIARLDDLGWEVASAVYSAVLADLAGDQGAALRLLDDALARPASDFETSCTVYAAAYRARLLLAAGRPVAARAALEDALRRAAPQHLVHPLVAGIDTRAGRSLLAEIAHDPREHPFATDVLDALHRETSSASRGVPGTATRRGAVSTTPLAQPLTERESEVLAELALGGSYQDVALALYITENTVKTHVSALYRKLGVERRADALRRARDLDLL